MMAGRCQKVMANAIFLSDDSDTIKKKVRQMITDPARIRKTDPGHPEVCNVFSFIRYINPEKSKLLKADVER